MEASRAEDAAARAGVDLSIIIKSIRLLLPLSGAEDCAREEAGCFLWDLSTNSECIELLVSNQLISALHAVLEHYFCVEEPTARNLEVCLGVLANLQIFELAAEHIATKPEIPDLVINTVLLGVSDSACLSECCRLISLGIRSQVHPL
jgi:hypothetical protein